MSKKIYLFFGYLLDEIDPPFSRKITYFITRLWIPEINRLCCKKLEEEKMRRKGF